METRNQWYKPNLLYNIHWRPPKPSGVHKPPKMIVETVCFNPSFCTCGEHGCMRHYRMERRILWTDRELSVNIQAVRNSREHKQNDRSTSKQKSNQNSTAEVEDIQNDVGEVGEVDKNHSNKNPSIADAANVKEAIASTRSDNMMHSYDHKNDYKDNREKEKSGNVDRNDGIVKTGSERNRHGDKSDDGNNDIDEINGQRERNKNILNDVEMSKDTGVTGQDGKANNTEDIKSKIDGLDIKADKKIIKNCCDDSNGGVQGKDFVRSAKVNYSIDNTKTGKDCGGNDGLNKNGNEDASIYDCSISSSDFAVGSCENETNGNSRMNNNIGCASAAAEEDTGDDLYVKRENISLRAHERCEENNDAFGILSIYCNSEIHCDVHENYARWRRY